MGKVQQSVYLEEEHRDTLAQYAKTEGRTFNEQIRFALSQWLDLKHGGKLMATTETQKGVTIRLEGQYEADRDFTNAEAYEDVDRDQVVVERNDKVIARYAIASLVSWESWE